jgi:hypothetical protein
MIIHATVNLATPPLVSLPQPVDQERSDEETRSRGSETLAMWSHHSAALNPDCCTLKILQQSTFSFSCQRWRLG